MPNEGRTMALTLLGKLLDKHERNPTCARPHGENLPKRSWGADEGAALYGLLQAAEAETQAIELVYGKHENHHNIVRIRLRNAAPLYAWLGRSSATQHAAETEAELTRRLPDLPPELRAVLTDMAASWSARKNLISGLGMTQVDRAEKLLRVATALMGENVDGVDMRSFSRRACGDSKFVEAAKGSIAAILRHAGAVPDWLDADDILASRGIAKYPQPSQIAGPITLAGQPLPAQPYIGLAPEVVPHLGIISQPAWIMTIENLSSFNQQVRATTNGQDAPGIVIYTNGFPGPSILTALTILATAAGCPVWHWGDIDPGGVRIAQTIARALDQIGQTLNLHMMTPEHAIRHGHPAAPAPQSLRTLDATQPIATLAEFLCSPNAHHLEQEELDPRNPINQDTR